MPMPNFDIDRATFDKHRKRTLSQLWEFGELMKVWMGGEPIRFAIKTAKGELAIQARQEMFGPIPAIYVGIGHELELSEEEVRGAMDALLTKTGAVPTIMQFELKNSIKSRGFHNQDVPQMIIDLQKELKPNKKRRQNIRKAIAAGVKFDVCREDDLVACHALSLSFGAKHKIRVMGKEFLRYIFDSKIVKIFTVKIDGKLVGFEAILLDKELAKTYSWLASWDERGLEANAPSLLTWEIIQWSKAQGFDQFDFGGIGFETEKKRSIAFFKESFGGELVHDSTIRTAGILGMRSDHIYKLIDHAYKNIYMRMHDDIYR